MLFPAHLSLFFESRFHLVDHRSKHNIRRLLHNTKRKILNIESFDLHRQLHEIKRELATISCSLSDQLPVYIWRDIYDRNYWFFEKYKLNIHLKNNKKLSWLRKKKNLEIVDNIKSINYTVKVDNIGDEMIYKFGEMEVNSEDKDESININITPDKFMNIINKPLSQTNEKWFINLSGHNIPEVVSNLLQLGEGFSMPFFKSKKESVIEFIKDFEGTSFRNNKQKFKIRNTVVTQLQKFTNNTQPVDNIQVELLRLLKITSSFCKENKNIIFTKADKGNITVALDREHYKNSMELLLKDSSTYEKIQKNPVKNLEQKLNNILKRWFSLGFISKQELYSLRNTDCSLSKAYGLPKIHKAGTPLRIIVSSINSTLYFFAKYLQRILQNCLPQANSHVKNSYELFNTLLGKEIPENCLMLSLDVNT